MREEIPDSAFDAAFEKADPEIILFISNLNQDDVLVNALTNLKLPAADARQVKREIIYVALGLAHLDEFGDNVLANTEGDEEVVNFVINFVMKNILPEIETIVKTYQINIQPAGQLVTSSGPRTSADILIKEIGVHNSGDSAHLDDHGAGDHSQNSSTYSFTPSKKDLLSEIESPTDTTKKPYFELPKSKPAAADILKGLVNAPYTMSDTVKITEGDQTITIIDPFKKMHADQKNQEKAQETAQGNAQNTAINRTIIPNQQAAAAYTQGFTSQSTPTKTESILISSNNPFLAPEINSTPYSTAINKADLDSKFNSIVKDKPKEVFTVSGHDPYREAPLS